MAEGMPSMKITGRANTRRMFNLFFKVGNEYVSHFSTNRMAPVWFHKTVREGRHTRRHFDMQSAEPGDSYEVQFFHRDTVYVSRILFEGRKQITINLDTLTH